MGGDYKYKQNIISAIIISIMQTKKSFIVSIIIALVIVVGVVSILSSKLSSNQGGTQSQSINEYDQYGSTSTEAALKTQEEIDMQIKGGATTDNQATSTTQISTFTLADIATHATETDCWTTIDGNVYNLTQFITEHPGGKRGIIGICGKDGTEAFREQHGKGGRAQVVVFAKYKVGILK
jgi:cytochrome b involved in lipid metabolism